MSEQIKPPAPRPCISCPYRRDVASGVWSEGEYAKLPEYDGPTGTQPAAVFMCHQQDGRLCAGWVACHDMLENMGLRIAASNGMISPEDIGEVLDYSTDVPVFDSGAEAAEHGMKNLTDPDEDARKITAKLSRKPGMRWR